MANSVVNMFITYKFFTIKLPYIVIIKLLWWNSKINTFKMTPETAESQHNETVKHKQEQNKDFVKRFPLMFSASTWVENCSRLVWGWDWALLVVCHGHEASLLPAWRRDGHSVVQLWKGSIFGSTQCGKTGDWKSQSALLGLTQQVKSASGKPHYTVQTSGIAINHWWGHPIKIQMNFQAR